MRQLLWFILPLDNLKSKPDYYKNGDKNETRAIETVRGHEARSWMNEYFFTSWLDSAAAYGAVLSA